MPEPPREVDRAGHRLARHPADRRLAAEDQRHPRVCACLRACAGDERHRPERPRRHREADELRDGPRLLSRSAAVAHLAQPRDERQRRPLDPLGDVGRVRVHRRSLRALRQHQNRMCVARGAGGKPKERSPGQPPSALEDGDPREHLVKESVGHLRVKGVAHGAEELPSRRAGAQEPPEHRVEHVGAEAHLARPLRQAAPGGQAGEASVVPWLGRHGRAVALAAGRHLVLSEPRGDASCITNFAIAIDLCTPLHDVHGVVAPLDFAVDHHATSVRVRQILAFPRSTPSPRAHRAKRAQRRRQRLSTPAHGSVLRISAKVIAGRRWASALSW